MLSDIFTYEQSVQENSFFGSLPSDRFTFNSGDLTLSSFHSSIATNFRSKVNQLASVNSLRKFDVGGSPKELTRSTCQSILDLTPSLHIHIGPESLDQIYQDNRKTIAISNANLSLMHDKLIAMGHQRQIAGSHQSVPNKYVEISQGLSLGQIRQQMHSVEPLLRDAEIVHFDMASLRSAESGGESRAVPTGLFAGEACQLMRYVGEGQNIRFVHIRTEDSNDPMKAMQIAQMVWYLVEGRSYVSQNSPLLDLSNYDSYLVGIDNSNTALTFYRDQSTNKWWASLESSNKYVPCSYEDYKGAVNGDIANSLVLLL